MPVDEDWDLEAWIWRVAGSARDLGLGVGGLVAGTVLGRFLGSWGPEVERLWQV